jgi:hypothetical protein
MTVAIIGGTGAYAASGPKAATPETGPTCVSLYNAKLTAAETALVKGDRAGALNSLLEAMDQLARCERRDQEGSDGKTSLSFNDLRP